MKIGLYDVDSHNFPNLPLMKISAYHKSQGDIVEKLLHCNKYDIVYVSKVFGDEYSKIDNTVIQADKVFYGGTGFAIKVENGKEVYDKEKDKPLPEYIENQYPDYSLYDTKTSYGFLTRGCPNNCSFCLVSQKEGFCSKKVADLKQFWNGQKQIKLLDANILACREHMSLLEQLANSQAEVDFTQGLDARFINKDNARLLNKIIKSNVHFAFDSMKNEKRIIEGLRIYKDNVKMGTSDGEKSVYVLTNYDTTFEEDWYRITKIRELGFSPYIMIYRKPSSNKLYKYLQRWCNNRRLYNSSDFKDYKPVNTWKIKERFKI
jgi:hypothetical protein